MKQYAFIMVFLFCIIVQSVFSQSNYRIKYQLIFQIDSTDSKNIQKEIMYLDITQKNESYFRSESTFTKDSILQSKNPQVLFNISKPKFKYCIVKKNSIEKINSYYDYAAYKFKLSENINLNWKFKNSQTKKILGYIANKATVSFKGRNYTAWYTNEITLQDGPYKFSSLPGLILEIYDNKKHYYFKAFSIQKLANYNPYILAKDYKKITKKQLIDFKKKIKQKPSLILYNPGIKIPKKGLDKYDIKHRQRNKYKNNPIELKNE